ncbi:hypothetical protein EDB85DRAFT_2145445 [Lactarius pseudohatsudake]|nr:hypothetical protein EDB85DRAFT_2145445 [Lactarius pseudohatsudake]
MDHPPLSSSSNGFSEPLSILSLDEFYDLQTALELAFFSEAEAEASEDQLTHEASTLVPPPLAPQLLFNTSPPFQPHTSSQQLHKVPFSAQAKRGLTGTQQHSRHRQHKIILQTESDGVSISKVPNLSLFKYDQEGMLT